MAPPGSQETLAGRGDAVGLEVQDRNYDTESLERLAKARGGAEFASADGAAQGSPEALGCIVRAFEEPPDGRLARLIAAEFEGRAAYIALYLEGPGAGRPADTAVAWVAAQDDCSILSVTQARI